ncbi:amidohydrolase family protein, partial [Patulibacter sp. S7RM1-6]
MRIDAHQHFWDLGTGLYPHLEALPAPANRSYGPDDLEPQLAPAGIDATVLVQAAGEHADTTAMLEHARRRPWIAGVVGWLDLLDPASVAAGLEAWAEEPLLVGLRHQIHDEPDPRWLLRPAVLESLDLLADQDVPFDVVAVLPEHLALIPEVAERVPGLRMVVDHLGKPPIADGGWEPWAMRLAEAAAVPGVHAKISGLDTAADPARWTAADLRPYVDRALELFGADRLMFGGDWPVLTIVGDYAGVVRATEELLADRADAERDAVWAGTARRFYGLDRTGRLPRSGGASSADRPAAASASAGAPSESASAGAPS